jgi:hypothetical protein
VNEPGSEDANERQNPPPLDAALTSLIVPNHVVRLTAHVRGVSCMSSSTFKAAPDETNSSAG